MNYSKDALLNFTSLLSAKGLAKENTAAGLRTAVSKIFADLSPDEEADVRKVDVPLAVRRFNNKNPSALSPSSLGQYQKRVSSVIKEFVRYVDDPASYTGIGRSPKVTRGDAGERPQARKQLVSSDSRYPDDLSAPAATVASSGLSFAFPLRPDFLAQVVVPRDLRSDEAKRLNAFIATLAADYSPN